MDEKLKKYSCDLTQELPRKVNETLADHVKTSDTASNVKSIVKEMITEKKEEVDSEQTEANLIIYRAKESNKENSEERQNEDQQFFDALCNDILGIGPVKTKNIIRLGKRNDQDDEQKPPRPLTTVESALIATKPTKGTRKHTSKDNKEMKKTKSKGECFKSKTAVSMWYTNADTLHNKLPELRNRIKHAKSPPSIIAITEVKPKNTRHPLTEPEIKIDGFDLFTKNIEQSTGRGLALYVKPELKAYEVIPEVTWRNVGCCSSPVQQSEHSSLLRVQEPLINNGK